ncbi:reverse transcriptase (RNA-dependent DNA polymerase) [Marinobacterium halophilum]|uniref:Reverse transcriptase (RNA-dependent DNA polymerase) n=1 Tax=Marinobacterium halophilum TaxID=267374 RepID=A0A2P8EVD7_9GAMM|nr:antiviral reverse transcriptase Drt3a [Marinobacterium halophilum]PSL13434.1 reverse transcriptase (RNA-dependent DNA polymerase) [Marinobacterium halophilum]
MERSYVARNLRKCISYGDILKNTSLHSELKRQEYANAAALLVDDTRTFEDLLRVIFIKSKTAYTVKKIENALILKLLSNNIKKNYGISIRNREYIVRNLISFLRESSPYHIHRYDIESFYESVDRGLILKKIKSDGVLSRKSISLLDAFFKELEEKSIPGLPRGLGISSTLSELALQNMDYHLRNTEGVFLYERFVDDIILITDTDIPAKTSRQKIEEFLPGALKIHKAGGEKTFFGNVSKPNDKKMGKTNTFSYLGYSYTISEKNHSSDNFLKVRRRDVKIDIAPSKTMKIKKRIIQSFSSYIISKKTHKEYDLLIKRLKFLSGNYRLHNISNINDVKSGIYYNYRIINQQTQLNELDRFLKSLLFFKGSNLSRRIQSEIPINKRREISHFSFKKGHEKKRFHNFTYKNLLRIKRAWR